MRLTARILWSGVCLVGFTSCGPKLGPNDLGALEKGAAALESLGGPSEVARMLEMLMGELELGHSLVSPVSSLLSARTLLVTDAACNSFAAPFAVRVMRSSRGPARENGVGGRCDPATFPPRR